MWDQRCKEPGFGYGSEPNAFLRRVADVERVAHITRQVPRAMLLIDSTLATPLNMHPFALGADLVPLLCRPGGRRADAMRDPLQEHLAKRGQPVDDLLCLQLGAAAQLRHSVRQGCASDGHPSGMSARKEPQ